MQIMSKQLSYGNFLSMGKNLNMTRNKLTCGYLAVSGSWLSVGSDQGNVHFVNVQQFNTSGYVINWNRAINV
ncbi:hypothetical protein ACTXT7_004316 [Hymenolepis weldensis]